MCRAQDQRDPADRNEAAQPRDRPLPELEEQKEDRGPDQIELLLDGQAPCVAQLPVGLSEEPEGEVLRVGRPQERCLSIADQRAVVAEVLVEDRTQRQHEDQGGVEPEGALDVEAAEPDCVSALPLRHQDRRDEVAGQDEEDVDADPASPQARNGGVLGNRQEDGQSAEPCQLRDVVHPAMVQVPIAAAAFQSLWSPVTFRPRPAVAGGPKGKEMDPEMPGCQVQDDPPPRPGLHARFNGYSTSAVAGAHLVRPGRYRA
jgi:hypothetical protein